MSAALLFLDDMQWCDLDSFELLSALLTSSAAAGVLVLETVRAEETAELVRLESTKPVERNLGEIF